MTTRVLFRAGDIVVAAAGTCRIVEIVGRRAVLEWLPADGSGPWLQEGTEALLTASSGAPFFRSARRYVLNRSDEPGASVRAKTPFRGSLNFTPDELTTRTEPPRRARAEFESDKAKFGSSCPTHGEIEDPIVGIAGTGADACVAFVCPWCSAPELLAAWEAEGRRS